MCYITSDLRQTIRHLRQRNQIDLNNLIYGCLTLGKIDDPEVAAFLTDTVVLPALKNIIVAAGNTSSEAPKIVQDYPINKIVNTFLGSEDDDNDDDEDDQMDEVYLVQGNKALCPDDMRPKGGGFLDDDDDDDDNQDTQKEEDENEPDNRFWDELCDALEMNVCCCSSGEIGAAIAQISEPGSPFRTKLIELLVKCEGLKEQKKNEIIGLLTIS
jgi:hypothetical protein